MKNKQKVVVAGRNSYVLIGAIRALGRAGYLVELVRTQKRTKFPAVEIFSKYVVSVTYTTDEGLANTLIEKLAQEGQKKVLIPVSDNAAAAIDENADMLKKYFLFSSIDNATGNMKEYMDKDCQKQLAKKAGLCVAEGVVVKLDSDEGYTLSDVEYPCYVKPQMSIAGYKSTMKKCDDEKQLISALNESVKKGEKSLLVEKYLQIEKEYVVPGVACNADVIIPAIIEKKRVGKGKRTGVTAMGKVICASKREDIRKPLIDFMKKINFCGIFDIELIESKGTIYFNELNLRNGAATYAITEAGVNLHKIYIEYLFDKRVCTNAKVERDEFVFASEKVLFDDYLEGYYTKQQYIEDLNSADVFFFKDKDDPKPDFWNRLSNAKDLVKQKIKR